MNRLRKIVECGSYGERTGRVAYVLKLETLPRPNAGFEWLEDSSFSAAEAVLADASLKPVFLAAIKEGHVLVMPKTGPRPAKRSVVFTVDVDGKPTVSFEASGAREAGELIKEAWFREDLQGLTSAAVPLWNGEAPLRVRTASEEEAKRYRGFAEQAEDESGDILLAFLVTLDSVRR